MTIPISVVIILALLLLYWILKEVMRNGDEAHNQRIRDAHERENAEYMRGMGFKNEEERRDHQMAVWESENNNNS